MRFIQSENKSDRVYCFEDDADGVVYSWCPSMDLLAVSQRNGKCISLYRMNGRKVYEIDASSSPVKYIEWRPDGKQLCVVCVDDSVVLYDVNSNEELTRLKTQGSVNFTRWIVMKRPTSENKFHGKFELNDIWDSLPKLTPLSISGAPRMNKTFSSKQAIDTMIQIGSNEENMDLLFAFGSNSVNLTLHGLFSLGPVEIFKENEDDEEIVNCISHSLEDHYILTSSFNTMQYKLRKFKTNFIQHYEFFSQITTLSSKIIALLGYIGEVLSSIAVLVKSYLDDHNRFLNVLRNELKEKGLNVGDELYNLLLTGMMSEDIKDWIQNSIGDRNLKRWTSSGEAAYNNTRKLLIYHLIPACDRLILLLSRSISVANTASLLDTPFDIAGAIPVVISEVKHFLIELFQLIKKINNEQDLFNEFILWLKFTFTELQEDSCDIEYSTSSVAEYISAHLERSVFTTLVPLMRMKSNKVTISAEDMFDSIRKSIRASITHIEEDGTLLQIPLGQITEKQRLKFIDDDLYVFSALDSTLEIFKVNVESKLTTSTKVEFEDAISDLQVLDDDNVLIVSGHRLVTFAYQYLFDQSLHTYKTLSLTSNEPMDDIQVSYVTTNTGRNIGCGISSDMKHYTVFVMNEI